MTQRSKALPGKQIPIGLAPTTEASGPIMFVLEKQLLEYRHLAARYPPIAKDSLSLWVVKSFTKSLYFEIPRLRL